jgi:cytochrome c2
MRLKWIVILVAVAAGASLAAAQSAKQKQTDVAKGKTVFAQCAVCHEAGSTVKKVGPGFKGLFKRAKMENGKPMTEAGVRAAIDSGGNGMPAYRQVLSAADKDALIAYLKTL